MKKIVALYFLFFVSNCFGQQVTFQKTYGGTNPDYGRCVQQTSDGGYIITGYTESFGAGDYDAYLIKTNASGDTLWTKTFGRTDNDRGLFVRQTTDGGYIITGLSRTPNFNSDDILLIKTDANGDSLWTKTLGGTNSEVGTCVQQTSDGGYIISGNTASFSINHYDLYLVKTDAGGNITWTKTYGGPGGDEMAYYVEQTTDGGYIATGYYTTGNIIDLLLVRTDSSGDTLWTNTYGGAGVDQGLCVNQTSDGGFIVAGTTQSFGAGVYDSYLIKTDANGDTLWTKTYGGTVVENALSIQQTTDGGYIFSGNTTTSPAGVYLVKTNSTGDTLWTKVFTGIYGGTGYSVQQTTDGGYVILGYTSSAVAGNFNIYLIKTDSSGNSGCAQAGTGTIVLSTITQIANPLIQTYFGGTVGFPPTIMGSTSPSANGFTTLCTSVGIAPISNFEFPFSIFPNPTTNNFTITFPNTINKGVIEIYNVLGKKILAENIFNVSQKEISINNINAGIYFVKVRDGEKEYSKKVVIE